MPDIKTRDVVKGTIKALDRSAVLGERMKEAYVRTKEKAGNSVNTSDSSVNEDAADQLTGGIDVMTHEAVHQIDQQGHRIIRVSGNAASKAQDQFRKNRQEQQTERFRNASGTEEPHLDSDNTPRMQRDDFNRVEKVENGRVYTIEGNTSDSCRERSYALGYYEILGYGIPAY